MHCHCVDIIAFLFFLIFFLKILYCHDIFCGYEIRMFREYNFPGTKVAYTFHSHHWLPSPGWTTSGPFDIRLDWVWGIAREHLTVDGLTQWCYHLWCGHPVLCESSLVYFPDQPVWKQAHQMDYGEISSQEMWPSWRWEPCW